MNWFDFAVGACFGFPAGVLFTAAMLLLLARFAEGRDYIPGPFKRGNWR